MVKFFNNFPANRPKISYLPAFARALEHKPKGALLLDMACCLGQDLRQAIAYGWPAEDTIASDIELGFWDAGHRLFKTTPETFRATFVVGNVFDLITPRSPAHEESRNQRPDLKSLTSLTPLQGHLYAIHVSSFFHIFQEEKQLELAKLLATLLCPLPGSVIFGKHAGKAEKGFRLETTEKGSFKMFCHSPLSWMELWDGQVFRKGTVRVEAVLEPYPREDITFEKGSEFTFLAWSVTRLASPRL